MNAETRVTQLALIAALLTCGWVILASAWLCDDAWITLRSIDNLLAGHGLRWNPAERVQTFTHPLWALLLAVAIAASGDFYFTVVFVSLACTAGAIILFACHVARTRTLAIAGVVALLASKAFVDFSTSGLENPLTHLLLVSLLAVWFREDSELSGERRLLALTLLAALLATNRLDSVLMALPLVLEAGIRCGRRAWRPLMLGVLPLVAWESFALVYYGFPVPNTAYAKLGTGLPAADLVRQGLHYLVDTALHDPATPLAILLGIAVAITGAPRSRPVALGIGIYLAYVVWIGGDFMSGRFLAAPLLCAAALITRTPLQSERSERRASAGAALALLVASLLGPHPTITTDRNYGVGSPPDQGRHGIVDERAAYYPISGAWRVLRAGVDPLRNPWVAKAAEDRESLDRVLLAGPVGLYGFIVGPEKYVLDEFALGDPLRARLPMPADREWRIGHFPRAVPEGYIETLSSGRNLIRDPKLAQLWDDVAIVTRGPLFRAARWSAILRLNATWLIGRSATGSSDP